jgi:acyl-coenzyme A synthetase/AMP-(fatty) acid ligase
MTSLTLYTSGSTGAPKLVYHSAENISLYTCIAAKTIGLTSRDRVLNVLPSHVIGYHVVTAGAAAWANSHLLSVEFNPYMWFKIFREFKPTYTVLIPRHIEILSRLKEWQTVDLSSLRFVVTGSQRVKQEHIDSLLTRGVGHVSNWYGMTEFPPPVLVGHNSESFDLTHTYGRTVEFTSEGECVIDGHLTGDIFDLATRTFSHRKESATGSTWKTDPK